MLHSARGYLIFREACDQYRKINTSNFQSQLLIPASPLQRPVKLLIIYVSLVCASLEVVVLTSTGSIL
jgi:hypothetical protein